MNSTQCEHVLQSCLIGRIGCYNLGKVYIVPVSYAFKKGYLYACSKEGLKVEMMRKNPKVCFQADQVDNLRNWRSIIAWGTFDEINRSQEQDKALKILSEKFHVFQTGDTLQPVFTSPDGLQKKEKKPLLFRIKIEEISGRFEKDQKE